MADAALALVPMLEQERFDVVVSDVLTLAPALAAERVGLRRATLIPHVYPVTDAGMPFFAVGAMPPRTPVGRALWRAAMPALGVGLRRGRDELNQSRRKSSGSRPSIGFTEGSARSSSSSRPSRSSSIRGCGRRTCW